MHKSMNEKESICSVVGMLPMTSSSYFGVSIAAADF